MEIEVEVLFHTEETLRLEAAGLDIPMNLFKIKTMTIYSVSNLYAEDGDKTTRITSGGFEYSVNMGAVKLKKLISEQIRRGNDIYNSNRN